LATPAVRNIAKMHSIDINQIVGSGRDGRVTKEDILKLLGDESKVESAKI
jgi:2-oxoisovalerate dehydrogenase E2 component (dihydrolipoyl transacylase)